MIYLNTSQIFLTIECKNLYCYSCQINLNMFTCLPFIKQLNKVWRDGRVVEGARLESV